MSVSSYASVKVWFDKDCVWVHWPSKAPESIQWTSLVGVAVETTDQGPLVEDVYWHIASKEKVITYPSKATGVGDLLKRLQELPTFNNERLIEAMSCAENQIWPFPLAIHISFYKHQLQPFSSKTAG